jgi:hypothetical protein
MQDVARQLWFNWDMPNTYTPTNIDGVPRTPNNFAVITPGANKLYIAFYVSNSGTAGSIRFSIVINGEEKYFKNDTIGVGEGRGCEWTGEMPSGDANVFMTVNPVNPVAGDSGTFGNVIIQPYSAGGSAVGQINAIRIQDVSRQKWFNRNNGVWDTMPSVSPGSGNLYVAFNAVNNGGAAGNLVLTIKESSSGTVLATKTVATAVGGNAGIEYTGSMPTVSYGITCTVMP